MAYTNKVLTAPTMQIRFLQTAKDTKGKLLEMGTTYHSTTEKPPVHYHPYQTEHFTIVNGEMTVIIDHKTQVFKKGESFETTPGQSHAMWNESGKDTIVLWKITPAMNSENFFETINGLLADGRPVNKGIKGLLQMSLTANKFSPVFRLAKPPFFVQKVVFSILSPIAWLLGYRSMYQEYID
ncbi:MAG: cupin domain-containing protein [Chitinophagaceae bacterium]